MGVYTTAAASYENGHKVVYVDGRWCWADTLNQIPEQTINEWKDRCSGDGWIEKGHSGEWRPCAKCLEYPNERGDDFCIQNLGRVWNACCGHGNQKGYVQFENGITIRGFFEIEYWDKEKWKNSNSNK